MVFLDHQGWLCPNVGILLKPILAAAYKRDPKSAI